MTKILIGVDGSERSEDAVAFGRSLARAADAPVVLATARRSDPLRPGAPDHETPCARTPSHARPSRRRAGRCPRPRVATAGCEHVGRACSPGARRRGARRPHHRRLEPHRPIRTGAAGEHRRATAARRALPRRRRAARLPNPRDTGASGGRLRVPTDRGSAALGAAEELALALSASLQVMQVVEPLARLYDAAEMPLTSRRSTHQSSQTRNGR